VARIIRDNGAASVLCDPVFSSPERIELRMMGLGELAIDGLIGLVGEIIKKHMSLDATRILPSHLSSVSS